MADQIISDGFTDLEYDLRQTEIMFEEIYDKTGNNVVGMAAHVTVTLGGHETKIRVEGPRIMNRGNLVDLLSKVAERIEHIR